MKRRIKPLCHIAFTVYLLLGGLIAARYQNLYIAAITVITMLIAKATIRMIQRGKRKKADITPTPLKN